jgi:hypothetical protein
MVIGAEPHCFGIISKNGRILNPTYCKEPRYKFVWWERTWKLRCQDKKSYSDHRRRELSFEVGDFVDLKVSPMRGLCRFKVRDKLAPRFIGPIRILEKRDDVAYQLEWPPQLSDVHDVFHVSQLMKCLYVPEEQILMEDLDAKEDLSYQKYPIKILEISAWVTRNKRIKMCKVQWSNHTEEEPTWERKEEFKAEFLNFFFNPSESSGWDLF